MRASMSVPGAFSPAKRGDDLLVDGGLVDNLPVELAREMGADIVIAVNVGTPLSGREQLNDVVGVMSQMVNLLTEQNVTASLASLSDRDILIRPELKDYTSADLDKSREIIAVGGCRSSCSRSPKGPCCWPSGMDSMEPRSHTEFRQLRQKSESDYGNPSRTARGCGCAARKNC